MIRSIIFKDEDDLNGEPIGPVVLTTSEGKQAAFPHWLPLHDARDLAAQYGLDLELA
jgi:hypothetical protein